MMKIKFSSFFKVPSHLFSHKNMYAYFWPKSFLLPASNSHQYPDRSWIAIFSRDSSSKNKFHVTSKFHMLTFSYYIMECQWYSMTHSFTICLLFSLSFSISTHRKQTMKKHNIYKWKYKNRETIICKEPRITNFIYGREKEEWEQKHIREQETNLNKYWQE
jgi:hypothetical protein